MPSPPTQSARPPTMPRPRLGLAGPSRALPLPAGPPLQENHPPPRENAFASPAADRPVAPRPTPAASTSQSHTVVAMRIYADSRREQQLWLTMADMDFRRGISGCHGWIRARAKTIGGQIWQPMAATNSEALISGDLSGHLDRHTPRASHLGRLSPRGWQVELLRTITRAVLRGASKCTALPWTCFGYRHRFGKQTRAGRRQRLEIAMLVRGTRSSRRYLAGQVPVEMMVQVDFGARVTGRPAFHWA